MDGNPDGTTPTSANPLPLRSNLWFATIPRTIARKGPRDPKIDEGTDFGRLSMACKGNRFSATRNAKVKAEKEAVKL